MTETVHTLHWLCLDSSGSIAESSFKAEKHACFMRSAAKPFQALGLLPFLSTSTLSAAELAIASASHSGKALHIQAVRRLLKRAGCTPQHLQCGSHLPMDKMTAHRLLRKHKAPCALHHNCSGKHASFLLQCEKNGWSKSAYLDREHPLQIQIKHTMEQLLEEKLEAWAVDDCGAPVPYLTLLQTARLYLALINEPSYQTLVGAMRQAPELVAGQGRIDTALISQNVSQLLSKTGAAGLIVVSNLESKQVAVLKVASGVQEVRDLAIQQLLQELGWLDRTSLIPSELSPQQQLVLQWS